MAAPPGQLKLCELLIMRSKRHFRDTFTDSGVNYVWKTYYKEIGQSTMCEKLLFTPVLLFKNFYWFFDLDGVITRKVSSFILFRGTTAMHGTTNPIRQLPRCILCNEFVWCISSNELLVFYFGFQNCWICSIGFVLEFGMDTGMKIRNWSAKNRNSSF